MKKLILASLAVILAACTSSNTGKNITLDDSLSLSDFVWTREPESFAIKGDTIEVTIRLKQAIIRLQIELGA
ncbi:MAG: hypothetical protein MJY56_05700, partial [Bacteroidales bacterium]|nr:hypothetical protein [Bacteroidales bacterium]